MRNMTTQVDKQPEYPTLSMKTIHTILRSAISICGLLACAFPVQATPPVDPICRSPNSLDLVQTLRQEAQSKMRYRPRLFSAKGPAAGLELAPRLSIARNDALAIPQLVLSGRAGQTYDLQAASTPVGNSWQSILTVNLGAGPVVWDDELGGSAPFRFYRLRSSEPDVLGDSVSTFRLLDQQGIARDLYYHTHLSAMVVLAAGNDLTAVSPWTNILAEIAKLYASRIQIWILHSERTASRSDVLAQARALDLSFPILADGSGLAAQSLGLTRAGEVAVVQPPLFTVAYRGAVGAAGVTTAAESYLGQALASLTADRPVTFRRTPTTGAALSHLGGKMPSYSTDVAPIFYKYCANCHLPNGVAPFALTNYSVVQEWAGSIKHALLSRRMPPWHADPEYGQFANDLSIPDESKATLIRWIDAGAPRGDGTDLLAELPSPQPFAGWPEELGKPDALVTIPRQSIKATGSEPYRYLFVQAPNPTNVWLRAAIIRPSNYKSVHHHLVWLGRAGNSGSPDNSSYMPHIAEFVPGYEPRRFPPDAGVLLSRSNWLTFNLHYTPDGIETNDQPVLALWYHRSKPKKTWNLAAPLNDVFVIPSSAPDHPVQATWTTPNTPIEIHRLNPHMHLRGKRMKFEVRYPNGVRETLLSVPDYDFNWQIGYTLAKPKSIPAGSQIIVSGAFDNSPQNLANPDPSASVRWGDQSWMEMFAGHIDYTQ